MRRALDAGRSAAELQEFLTAHSRTPVPQPLAYLIDDVARKHGRLRIGAATAYVRCDDDALLSEIVADRRAAPSGCAGSRRPCSPPRPPPTNSSTVCGRWATPRLPSPPPVTC